MAPTIDIIRHAEAHHNIAGPDIPDPRLTHRGLRQCLGMQARYKKIDSGANITHIISSPLRRAIETSLHIAELAQDGSAITLNPHFQEVNATPSSTGTAASQLLAQYPGAGLDAARVDEHWYRKGPDTPFAPDAEKLETRALRARCFLLAVVRDLATRGRSDARVVVVTHGEFAHWLTNDFAGTGYARNSSWHTTEIRSYRFEKLDPGAGDEVPLVETRESLERRGLDAPVLVTDEERAELKRIATIRVVSYATSYAEKERKEREARVLAEDEEWEEVGDEEANKENTAPPPGSHPIPRRRHRHGPSSLSRSS
ncbi:phosphoglycerate mutase-like protein [Annulohypoxylon truncatum]|uniref:phosphoglycerate mutase-like protein n=1 Tax=Annulohypoxylon truncatum TaxID=327061 RepID=UPI002007A4BF|nr:phosphoglycerate mutase-like protein [Annulohypoxylon truncatum]KAI1210566.1 phosphoglycerate mutase-like protein [Annulohypoxylon truncatum]